MAVFASKQIVMPVLSIAVTITGTGRADRCYATINGTNQYEAGTHEVNAGDTITFGVYGEATGTYSGSVTIDGTQVLRAVDSKTHTYDWTVPSGISTIEIEMKYWPGNRKGRITVTTA